MRLVSCILIGYGLHSLPSRFIAPWFALGIHCVTLSGQRECRIRLYSRVPVSSPPLLFVRRQRIAVFHHLANLHGSFSLSVNSKDVALEMSYRQFPRHLRGLHSLYTVPAMTSKKPGVASSPRAGNGVVVDPHR